jgi:hypothetical protein
MSNTYITWDMQYAGVQVLDEAKIGDDKYELSKKIYNAMEAKKDGSTNFTWYGGEGSYTLLADFTEGQLRSRLRQLVTDLGDKMASMSQADILTWIGRFTRELERRAKDKVEKAEAAAKCDIDWEPKPMYYGGMTRRYSLRMI